MTPTVSARESAGRTPLVVGFAAFVALSLVFLAIAAALGPRTPSFRAPLRRGAFAEGELVGPVAVAYSDALVYVSDPGAGVVRAYDRYGAPRRVLRPREYGTEGFLLPGRLCPYENGVLVCDPEQRQLFFYDRRGRCVSAFIDTPLTSNFRPEAVAASRDGRVAVADNANRSILVFGPDGRLRARFDGAPGQSGHRGASLFARCSGLVWLGGDICLLDADRLEIVRVDPASRRVERVRLSVRATDVGFLEGLAVRAGRFLVADALLSRVYEFDEDGALLGWFGAAMDERKRLSLPVAVAAVGDELFVVEKGARRVSAWGW